MLALRWKQWTTSDAPPCIRQRLLVILNPPGFFSKGGPIQTYETLMVIPLYILHVNLEWLKQRRYYILTTQRRKRQLPNNLCRVSNQTFRLCFLISLSNCSRPQTLVIASQLKPSKTISKNFKFDKLQNNILVTASCKMLWRNHTKIIGS